MSWDYDEEEAVAGNGVYFNAQDIVNHLLIIWVVGYLPNGKAPTINNPDQDAVVVDIVDLDQKDEDGNAGLLATGNRFFQSRVIRDLKNRAGRAPVLAYLTRVPGTRGQPPYELVMAHTDPECRARADEWRSRHPDFTPTSFGEPAKRTEVQQPAATTKPPAATNSVLERLRNQASVAAARLQSHHSEGDPPF